MGEVVFTILSFEGPDSYSHVGGLGTRVTGLSSALADLGFETHLFFVGDPALPGHQTLGERLHLHRWCQWISRYHPGGVYDGEEGKLADWNGSLPWWLDHEFLPQKMAAGDTVVVLAEEWQTTASLIALRGIAARRGWLGRMRFFWNANNTFSFHRIDWAALRRSATITTVSRYMKHVMWGAGVDPVVVPNGIPERWLELVERCSVHLLTQAWPGRVALAKIARWDPDKRWDMAIDAVGEMKRLQLDPLLLARGGQGEHGWEVMARAERHGLRVRHAGWTGHGVMPMAAAIRAQVADADVVLIDPYLDDAERRALFRAASVVLANSGVEPFGLVGLETMAVGGVAFVGATGEDYATPGYDSISLQTSDPLEIVRCIVRLLSDREGAQGLRAAARRSAARYTWPAVVRRVLLPVLEREGVVFPAEVAAAEAAHHNGIHQAPLPPALQRDAVGASSRAAVGLYRGNGATRTASRQTPLLLPS